MKKRNIVIPFLLVMIIGIFSFKKFEQQGNEPWKADQLTEPPALWAIINDPSANQPIIYSIGFGDEMGFINQKLMTYLIT